MEDTILIKAQLEPAIKTFDYSVANNKKLIIAVFVEWAHMIGVKEPNTADENIINAKFIIANFGDMTITEIRQAIHWSIVGKLDIDATCYGKLSPIYMAKILNAYLNIRDNRMAIMRYKLSQFNQEKNYADKFTKPFEQRLTEKRTFLIEHMGKMKTERQADVAGMLIWKFLKRAGLVNDDKFSQEAKAYGKEQLQKMKMNKDYRMDMQKLTKAQVMDSDENYVLRCIQDYTIWKLLQSINDIAKLVNSQPSEILIPKEQH